MSETIGSIIGSVIVFGTIGLAIAYVFTMIRNGGINAQKELSTTLKDMLDVQDKKINELQDQHRENIQKISNLEGRVEELSKKNGDLQQIIERALENFFSIHPEEAMKLATIKSMRKSDV